MSSWTSLNRVVTAYPGPRDSFVVTLGDGKRANKLVRDTKLAVKVLPMTAAELINFAGITTSDLSATPEADADLRRHVVAALREAMIEADDRETRVEAQALLAGMGEAPC